MFRRLWSRRKILTLKGQQSPSYETANCTFQRQSRIDCCTISSATPTAQLDSLQLQKKKPHELERKSLHLLIITIFSETLGQGLFSLSPSITITQRVHNVAAIIITHRQTLTRSAKTSQTDKSEMIHTL